LNVWDFIKGLIEQFAPALAVSLWDYQEGRVDHEEKEKEAADLALKNMQDEKTIRDKFSGSDSDTINSIISPDKSKPDSKS